MVFNISDKFVSKKLKQNQIKAPVWMIGSYEKTHEGFLIFLVTAIYIYRFLNH